MLLAETDILLRLFVGLLIGAVLGFERTKNKKPAGIRTHALVSIASTSIAIISAYGFAEFENVRTMDPARLIVGIITGIGFLGAGIIWKENSGDVRGLTTAANIWAAAGLGIAVGLGHFFLVFTTLAFMLFALEISKILRWLKIIKYDECKVPEHTEPLSHHDD